MNTGCHSAPGGAGDLYPPWYEPRGAVHSARLAVQATSGQKRVHPVREADAGLRPHSLSSQVVRQVRKSNDMRQNQTNRKKRGAALVEYGLLVAGVALVTAVAVAVFGHKVNDMMGTAAAVLPSSDAADTGALTGGRLIQTQGGNGQAITIGNNVENGTLQDTFGVQVDDLIDDTQN